MKQIEIKLNNKTGHVLLHDPLPLVKLANFEEAIEAALKVDSKLGKAKSHALLLPSILESVAEWHIDGIPEQPTMETFPGMGSEFSKRDITLIINSIVSELIRFMTGKDPNA